MITFYSPGIKEQIIEIKSVKNSFTSAQILSMNTSPVQIVAAPGANKSLFFISGFTRFNFVTTAYSSAGQIQIQNGSLPVNVANCQTAISIVGFVQSTATRIVKWQGSGTGIGTNISQIVANDNLVCSINTANPTLGDGTIDSWIMYGIMDM